MGLRGIVLGVAVLAGAIAAPGVPTADAMPQNDEKANVAQVFVPDPDLTGVRRKAERVNGPAIDPELLTLNSGMPPVDDGDPPLLQPAPPDGLQPFSNCPDRASVMSAPTSTDWYAQRTVWYEITRDATGAPFSQDTLVTIDTAGSTFASALEVFSGAQVPADFDPAAPVLPTNVVACDRNPSGGLVPQLVSFIAAPGQRYFLMAGVAPFPASPGSATLRLSMRILDIETPVVSIGLDDVPDVKEVFEYKVASKDPTAIGPNLTISQLQLGKTTAMKPVALGAHCGDRGRLKSGQYCVTGNTVRVHWLPVRTATKVTGTVTAVYTDRAGNVGINRLQTQLRDREPPVLSSNTTARWTRRGRLFVTATCRGGPGTIEVQVGAAKKSVRKIVFNSKTMRLKRAFPTVRRRTTFVHVICRDRSKNADDTWLFLPG
jgi:hypothetical protein